MTRRATWTPASKPTSQDVQVKRIQQVMRETVPDAVCKAMLDGTTVICGVFVNGEVEVRFDLSEPSYADLGRHALRLQDKVTEARAAAARRAGRVVT